MPQFPNLEIEDSVQLNDRTRLNADKSYISRGGSAIADVKVKPGKDGTAITVFNADSTLWFLDWEFSTWNCDIDSINNKIDFSEGGGSALVASIPTGTYTLAQLAAEFKTQLDAAGALTYTVTVEPHDKIKIAANGPFKLLTQSGDNREVGILKHVGFREDEDLSSNNNAVTGGRVEYLMKEIAVSTFDNATPTPNETIKYKWMKVFSVEGDRLFSTDELLRVHEADILKWVFAGRNTFKDVHRKAQTEIINWLDKNGYTDINDKPFTKFSIIDRKEVKEWATFCALKLIFAGIHNSVDDVFKQKSKDYHSDEIEARERAILRIDVDGDGKADSYEGLRTGSGSLFRR